MLGLNSAGLISDFKDFVMFFFCEKDVVRDGDWKRECGNVV